jgi:long-chain acyl-CoA synthetase
MYTSGTTDRPDGVMLTHVNLCANAHALSAEHGLTATDRELAVLPLFHINAFAVTMRAPLAHGSSLALVPKFSAARFWSQAIQQRCTRLSVVPSMVSNLLESDPDNRSKPSASAGRPWPRCRPRTTARSSACSASASASSGPWA